MSYSARKQRPVIAVTGPEKGGFMPWIMTKWAIRRAGGRAVRIHTGCAEAVLEFDGLVLGGGSDIHPDHYGDKLMDLAAGDEKSTLSERLADLLIFLLRAVFSIKLRQLRQDPARDQLEKALVLKALARELPVLGICRGEQMINVALGGTLHQETRSFYTESPDVQSIRPVKDVTIAEGSRLGRIVNSPHLRVNALHSQAVDRLGSGLEACARDRNGIVQAIEHPGREFVIGVQWHPEYLPGQTRHQRLFRALVGEAKRCASDV